MNNMQHKFTWQTPNWLRVLCLTLLVGLASVGAYAQATAINYEFGVSSGTYSSIASTGTSRSGAVGDDAAVNFTISPGFVVNGVTYTNVRMCSNGWLALYATTAPTATTNYTPLSTAATGANVRFAPFGADLNSQTGTGAYSQTIGNEHIFEWLNYTRYFVTGDAINCQIRLNYVTNEIKFVYGAMSVGASTTSPQVGWKTAGTVAANWATDINNVQINSTGSPASCDWSNAVTGNANTSVMQFSNATPGLKPLSGLTYTWSPRNGLSPVRTFGALTGITSDGATLSWTAPLGATQYNIQYRISGSNCGWTNWSGNPVSTNSVTLTGLNSLTSYQVIVQSSNATVNGTYSHIPTSAAGAGLSGYSAAGTFTTLSAPCAGAPTPGNTITSNASPCAGSSFNLSLQNAISGTGVTYQWQSADDSLFTVNLTNLGTATTQSTSAPYSIYYRCLVTCGGSAITTASNPVAVNVNPLPTVVITPSNGGAFCGNGIMTASGANTYAWAPSSALSSSTGSSVVFTGIANTTFTVTGTSAAGCVGTTTQAVTYVVAPAITVTSSTPVFCGIGGTTTLTATSANSNYVYTFSSLTPSATLSNITANTADATLSVTSDFLTTANDAGTGCMSSVYTSVGVYPLPTAILTTSANGVCPGTAATINSGLTAGNFSASCITPAPLTIPATAAYLVNNGTAVQALASGSLDDGGWSGIPLGFNFDFFGTNYTTLNVGTNGVLQFGAYNATALADFTIGALPNTADPLGAVYACANDLHCGTTGTPATYVRYWTEGYAPNRRFVIEYNVFQYGSTTNRVNVQVIVYETLGMVDVIAKQIMSTNSKSIGVNSPTGTIGASAPNCTTNAQNYWSAQTATIAAANPQAWRFAPPSNYNVVWSENGTQFASGLNIFSQSVSPAITTLYSIIYTNTTTGCSNPANSATVNMTIGIDPGATLANGVSGNYMACPSQTITYSMANSTNAPGLTFQWFNLSGAIPGATNNTYVTTMVGYDEVYCEATCSGGSTYQSGLVVVDMNSFINCYCTPTHTYGTSGCFYGVITNVQLNTLNSSPACLNAAPYYFLNAPIGAETTSLLPGQTYTISVTSGAYNSVGVWIDYNQNGIYEATEYLTLTPNVNSAGASWVATGVFTIPVTAIAGLTGMRVRTEYYFYTMAATSGCDPFTYGETEDYRVTMISLPSVPMAPSEVGVPNCITGGTLSSNGAAPAGETWYWQSTATGTSTAQPVSSNLTILSNGTYYVRAQNNSNLAWSLASSSITVTSFPAGPADPVTAAQGGNPACGSVTLLSSPAVAGSTNYWQGTNAVGTSTSIVADNVTNNFPYTASSNGTYYIRAQDDITQCWSNPVATPVTIYALPTAPVLSATPGTICPGSTSALTAVAPSAPPAGYSVSAIPYAPVSPISTTLAGAGPTGDEGTVVAPLGFSFNYYGTTYSDVQIHTNGYIVFGTNNYVFGSYTPPAIPSTAASNNWVGYWSDMNASAGQITYETQGTAPNRVFIANYNQDQYYSATPYYSGQIVVYEATGAIDVFLEHTQTTYTSACGMENQTGTLGTAAPGRNSGSWAATNEAWHFAPIQLFGFMWSPNGAGSGINAGDETLANISVTPSATTLYTMTITDPAYGCQNASSINVTVAPIPPAPTAIGASTPCGAGTVTLTATGTGGTLRWYSAPTGGTILATGSSYTTPLINATTTYYVEEFNGACSGTRTAVDATYTPSPVATATSSVAFVCAGGSATLTASSSNATYAYTWQPGALTGSSVTVNPLVNTTYTVTAIDGPCVNVATVTVMAGANPNIVSVIATPNTMCAGATSQLFVSVMGAAGGTAPSYCTPTLGFTGATGDYIESFTFNTISNLYSGDNLSDYATYPQTTTVIPGNTYPLTATPGAAWGQGIGVWMDFNHNGSFADAGEFVFSSASGTATVSGNVTIPSGATPGLTAIRVCAKYGATPASTESCGHTGFGEYEDYTMTIVDLNSFNYSWTGSGLSSTTTYNPTATPSATGTYTVTVADGTTGCTSTASVVLNVIQLAPAPSVTGGATACGVGPVVLSASGTGGTLNWYNAPTGGTLVNTGSTYTTTAISSTTTYYVDETVGACTGPRAAVVATYTPSPVVTASSDVAYVCVGGANSTAVLTASSPNASYSYTWQPGGMTGASVTVTPTGTTTYTVTAVDGPCSNVATVTVNGPSVPVISSTTASPTVFCGGGTSQLQVNVVGGTSGLATGYCVPTETAGCNWDIISNVTFAGINNSTGCGGANQLYTSPNPSINAGGTYPLSVTTGADIEGAAVWIDYDHSGTFDSGEEVLSGFAGTVPATYAASVTIPANAVGGQTLMRVRCTYNSNPTGNPCGTVFYGETENYYVNIVPAASFNYSWSPAATLSSATAYNPSAAVSSTTAYTVTVSESTYGCSATSGVTVTVNPLSSSTTAITTCAPIVWNGTTYATAGTYTYTSQNAAGCDSVATLNLTIACSTVVNLTCLIQGYWDAGSSAMLPVLFNQGELSAATACDSIDVELRDITTYAMVQSVRTVLNQNGTANCVFPATTGDYYIVVKHRSAIQTWSALPVTVGPTAVSYNFTTAANQAFGDNQVEVSTGVWALYSGDIIIDENIDLLDLGTLELDISNFSYGYVPTDLNGDGNVDLLDSPVVEANISNFVFSYHP